MTLRKNHRNANGHAEPHGRGNGAANGSLAKVADNHHKDDKIPPGKGPLPVNPGEFVEEIHRRIDLIEVWKKQLESKDEKIRQRAVEKLTEMGYKGAAGLSEEPQQIIFDMPRPNRD